LSALAARESESKDEQERPNKRKNSIETLGCWGYCWVLVWVFAVISVVCLLVGIEKDVLLA
jgi:hypothetical protein